MKRWMTVVTMLLAVAAQADMSHFRIEFGGAVVHVFSGNVRRAVAIDVAHHVPVLITSILTGASQKILKNTFRADFDCETVSDACTIDMKGLRLWLAATDDGIFVPQIDEHTTFMLQVPHLKALALDKQNHPFIIHPDALDAQPKGKIVAMFDFTGGKLTSTPFSRCKSRYEPEVVQQTDFTSGVTLEGYTTTPVVLMVSSKAHPNPETLEFVFPNDVLIGFGNSFIAGTGSCSSHLDLHVVAATDSQVTLPKIVTTGCVCMFGLAPGCSNTQWP